MTLAQQQSWIPIARLRPCRWGYGPDLLGLVKVPWETLPLQLKEIGNRMHPPPVSWALEKIPLPGLNLANQTGHTSDEFSPLGVDLVQTHSPSHVISRKVLRLTAESS